MAAEPEMSSFDLIELLRLINEASIDVWLDGGWGVDALLQTQTRPHKDVDLVLPVADVPFYELIIGVILKVREIVQISGVGEFIQIDNSIGGMFGEEISYEVGPDEARPPGDENLHLSVLSIPDVGDVVLMRVDPELVRLLRTVGLAGHVDADGLLVAYAFETVQDQRRYFHQHGVVFA